MKPTNRRQFIQHTAVHMLSARNTIRVASVCFLGAAINDKELVCVSLAAQP